MRTEAPCLMYSQEASCMMRPRRKVPEALALGIVIALLLLFIIGPAEEIFWRGYVQRALRERLLSCGGRCDYMLSRTLMS